jgi:nicotinamidase-related amidase
MAAMLNLNESVLVVVDVQTRLAHIMHDHERLYHTIERIIKVSQILEVPILWTEQAPDKIGPTIPSIQQLLSVSIRPIAKRSFSAWQCEEFVTQLQRLNRRQIILVGIETHVCIYQTASDLKQHGFDVFVAADAVSSRSSLNSDMTLRRMRHEDITVTIAESVICELIKTADHPKFKDVMTYIK